MTPLFQDILLTQSLRVHISALTSRCSWDYWQEALIINARENRLWRREWGVASAQFPEQSGARGKEVGTGREDLAKPKYAGPALGLLKFTSTVSEEKYSPQP